MQGADQGAHQRVGRQAAEVLLGAHRRQQSRAQGRVGARRLVPAPDEHRDVVAAHGGERELGEVLAAQPLVPYRGRARGHQPQIAGERGEEVGEPAPGAGPFLFGDLVHAVDQQHSASGGEHTVRPAVRLGAGRRAADRAQEVTGDGEGGAAPGEGAKGQYEGHTAHEVGELTGELLLAGGGDGEPLDERGLAGPGDAAQQHPLVPGQCLLDGPGRGRRLDESALVLGQRADLTGPRRRQAQIRRVERPVRAFVQIDAVDGEPAVPGREVARVLLLEGRVLRGARGQALDQDVGEPDQPVELPALLDEGAGHEGRALGEEVQDVHACAVEEMEIEERGVVAEIPQQPVAARLCVQLVGQRLVAEPYGLQVVQVQIAERVQGPQQGPGHRFQLSLVQRCLACLARRPFHQLADELAQLPVAEPPLIAPEGHQRRQPHGPVHQPGTRALLHEQPLHQRADQAGRDSRADDRRVHAASP